MNTEAPDEDDSANGGDPDNAKIAFASPLIAFGVLLVALIPFFLWTGRGEWFEHDDWDYLVLRKAGNFGDLVRPHNGHWETIPVLVYRMLWAMFGLTYRPFQFVSIILSLIGAAIFLVVLLRARTRPWIALIFATLLVLFAPAQTNVALKVTSITFVGFAVPFGLAQLLLADHDGPRNRRDWFGLAAGLAGVLCSSVALAMVFVVGVAMLYKRGWRIALFMSCPRRSRSPCGSRRSATRTSAPGNPAIASASAGCSLCVGARHRHVRGLHQIARYRWRARNRVSRRSGCDLAPCECRTAAAGCGSGRPVARRVRVRGRDRNRPVRSVGAG